MSTWFYVSRCTRGVWRSDVFSLTTHFATFNIKTFIAFFRKLLAARFTGRFSITFIKIFPDQTSFRAVCFSFTTARSRSRPVANKPDILIVQGLPAARPSPHWRRLGTANLIYSPLDFCLHCVHHPTTRSNNFGLELT